MQSVTFTGLQIAGIVLVAAGALLTFAFPRSLGAGSPAKENAWKAAGLALVASGALFILI